MRKTDQSKIIAILNEEDFQQLINNDPGNNAENVSQETRTLFTLALRKKREKNYQYTWMRNDTVYMKKSDFAKIEVIKCENDLVNTDDDDFSDINAPGNDFS